MAEAVTRTEEVVARWSGKNVDADRIESELGKLRYEAAGRPEQGQAFALRTSFINLVVYANDEETARHASRTIAAQSGQHPTRAIIVIARPDAREPGIDTGLAAHCHVAPGVEQQVCCEEVTLTVNGPAADHLHSVLAPLLIPDLPVYLWWIGALPHDHHLFGEMMDNADRFIVDSARFTDAAHDLWSLEHLSSRSRRCQLGDLNWQRLQPWRQIVAQQCAAPSLDGLRQHLSAITISFAGREGDERWSQALLMSGWLSEMFELDTLDLRVQGKGRAKLEHDGREVSLRLVVSEYPRLRPGELGSLELRYRGDGATASVEIARTSDPLHLRVNVHEPQGVIESHQRIESGDEGLMLARELDALTHDPQYHDALLATLPLVAAVQ